MTTIQLFPDDSYNQKTIRQGHPPGRTNRTGGDYDLVVLGGGPAGLISAITARQLGRRVAMTEQRLTGGTCVNFGCTPSKALIRCARGASSRRYGVRTGARKRAAAGGNVSRVWRRP